MVSTLLDEAALGPLLAIGGEGLRTQLLEDLQGCEDELADLCADASIAATESPKRLRQALHKLRGIALTIGAPRLAEICAATETATMTSPPKALLPQVMQVCADSRDLRARISQFAQDTQ